MSMNVKILQWITHKDWIRFGMRKRMVQKWCQSRDLNISFTLDYFGFNYRGNLRDYIDRCVFFYGAYEKANLQLLKDISSKVESPVFVDIGANVGQHSLWMAQFCDVIHAFEPWGPVRHRLEEKVRLNSLSHVYVHGVGLGEKEESLTFYAPPESDTGIGSFIETHHDWNKDSGQMLPIKVGDQFFEEHGIKPNIIKLDVEGFEKNVLCGLSNILTECKPTILLEFSPTTREQFSSYQDLLDIFPYPVTIQKVIDEGGWKYSLKPFNFNECSDILITFNEMSE